MKTTSKLLALAVMAFMLVGAFAIVADQGGADATDVGDDISVSSEQTYAFKVLSLPDGDTAGTVAIRALNPTTLSGDLDLSGYSTVTDDSSVTWNVTAVDISGFTGNPDDEYELSTVTLPTSITVISNYAFYKSGVSNITLHEGITQIGQSAFNTTNLTSITVPSTVTTMGEWIFADCKSLNEVVWNTSYNSFNSGIFSGCTSLNSINIPDTIVTIGGAAFQSTAIPNVTIPATVTTIGAYAFRYATTQTVVINGSFNGDAQYAFAFCTSLTSLTINSEITTIPNNFAEGDTSLATLVLPNTITEIKQSAFQYIQVADLTLPTSLTTLGAWVFAHSAIETLTLSADLTVINANTFLDCDSLRTVNWNNAAITSIGGNAFNGTGSLESISIPASVESIGAGAFGESGLRAITFEGNATTLENLNAFPKSGYQYPNGAILDDWSPALEATNPAGEYVATFEQQADSWTTEPSIATEFTYGDSITFTEGVAASGNAVTYTYVGMGATVYTESATAPTDAGTYALHAVTAESDEYKSLSSHYNFTIAPATNTWTTPFAMTTTEFTYPEAVTYTPGVAAYGEVHYVITDANNNAVDGWPTEVGTYSVYAVVDETVNYTGLTTADAAIEFTIALPSGGDVAVIDGSTYSTIAAAQDAGLAEFIVAADMELVEDVVLASGQSLIFVTGATFTGSIEYITDAEPSVTSVLRAINLVAGSPIVIVPGSIELSGTMSADYLVLSGEVVVTANTTISAGTMLVFANDCVLTNQNEATLTIEAGAYYYNEGATLPADTWFVNNGTAVAADYIGDNEVAVAKNSAGQVYLTLEIQDGYVGDVTGAGFVRVSWTVTDSEDAAIEYTGEVSYPNDAETFGVLVGNLTPGDYTISMYMYYTYGYSQVVRSISVDKPFTVLPQDVIIGAYYSHSAYHAVLYNVLGDNLDAGDIYVDAFTAQTGELTDGTEFQYIGITSQLTAAVDGTSAGGAYDLEGTVDIENMVALQPWYQIAGSSAKLYAFETVAYSTTPTPVTPDVNAYSDLAAVVSIAVEGEVTGGVWVYAVDALDGAALTAIVDSEHTYTAEVTIGAGEFMFFEFATDFVDDSTDTPADISAEDIAYFLITALTDDGTTVTDAHLSLVVLDYQ